MTVAYGNLLVAGPYGFPPARERRENEKALCPRPCQIDLSTNVRVPTTQMSGAVKEPVLVPTLFGFSQKKTRYGAFLEKPWVRTMWSVEVSYWFQGCTAEGERAYNFPRCGPCRYRPLPPDGARPIRSPGITCRWNSLASSSPNVLK